MPERQLLTAMLQRALFDYFGSKSDHKAEAAEWLFDGSTEDEAFSFAWVCTQLNLDPRRVLRRITGFKRNRPRTSELTAQQWFSQLRYA